MKGKNKGMTPSTPTVVDTNHIDPCATELADTLIRQGNVYNAALILRGLRRTD
jgi:hypothetical protein